MDVMRLARATLVAAAVVLAPAGALAQEQQPAPPPAPEQPPQPEAPATPGSAVTNSKVFNPDMAVIGDFLGAAGTQPIGQPDIRRSQMHESEASFQAVVDPYARADFFISFGEEGVELEEGFLTLHVAARRPADEGRQDARGVRQGQHAAQPRAAVGRSAAGHQNLVGGEDGIDDAGISVARLIPNPWIFLEATGQVFRGDSGADEHRSVQTSQPRRAELRRPPARLPGHHRERRTSISAFSYVARPQRVGHRQLADIGSLDDAALRHRRDATAGSRCSARSTTRSSAAPR